MSVVPSMNGRRKCIVHYRSKQRHVGRDEICCSGAAPNQLSIDGTRPLCDKAFERIMAECLDGQSMQQEFWPDIENSSPHRLTLRPISNKDTIPDPHEIIFKGALNAFNEDLVCKLEEIILELYVPRIQVKAEMSLLTSKARLVIGYLNLLMCVKLDDHLRSSRKQDLSPMFAQLILVRIDRLVTQFLEPVRSSRGAIDLEYRDGLALWYLFLPQIKVKQPNLDPSRIFRNRDLFYLVWKWCISLDEELTKRFKADCKYEFDWDAAFPAQRQLSRDLKLMEFSELSINLEPYHGTVLRFDDLERFESNQGDHYAATFNGSLPILFGMDPIPLPSSAISISPFLTPMSLMQQSPGTLGPNWLVPINETQGQVLNGQSYNRSGADSVDATAPDFPKTTASQLTSTGPQSSENLVNRIVGDYPMSIGSNLPMNPISSFQTSPLYSFESASVSGALNESYTTSPNAFSSASMHGSEGYFCPTKIPSSQPWPGARMFNDSSPYANLNGDAACSGTCPNCCLPQGHSRETGYV